MPKVGDTLTELFSEAKSEIVLVAPFMKAAVVARIVDAIAVGLQIVCITRWRPNEINAGVNDLEIWDVLQTRGNTRLLLIPTLHAKYYRADDRWAIGSANLTNMALGWAPNPNIELLITGDVDTTLQEWESGLISQGIEVDDALVQHFRRLVEELPATEYVLTENHLDAEESIPSYPEASCLEFSTWLPMLRYPDQLYDVYAGNLGQVSGGAQEAAVHDLMALTIPRGLDSTTFKAEVAAVLLQMPLVHRVDQYLSQSRRFGSVREFIEFSDGYPEGSDATTDWQTLMRWLLYFLPTRYRRTVPRHSEVIYRVE